MLYLVESANPRRLLAASDMPRFQEVMAMRIDQFTFGSIRIDGVVYEHDVVIARERIAKPRTRLGNESLSTGCRTALAPESAPYRGRSASRSIPTSTARSVRSSSQSISSSACLSSRLHADLSSTAVATTDSKLSTDVAKEQPRADLRVDPGNEPNTAIERENECTNHQGRIPKAQRFHVV